MGSLRGHFSRHWYHSDRLTAIIFVAALFLADHILGQYGEADAVA